jgi:hypothetical protein
LLTGARPFAGNEIQTLQAILHDVPVPPRQVNPMVPMPLERLTMRLLEKDRARRFASGQEVADALMTLLGPGDSTNVAADFAVRMMDLDDPARAAAMGTQNVGSQSVQTVIAAKPQTEWLMKAAPYDSPSQEEWRADITGSGDARKIAPGQSLPTSMQSQRGPDESVPSSPVLVEAPKRGLAIGLGAGSVVALVAAIAMVGLRADPEVPPVVPSPVPVVVAPPPAPAPAPATRTPPPGPVPAPAVVTPPPPSPSPSPMPSPVPTPSPGPPPVPAPARPVVVAKKTSTSAPEGIRWESSKGKVLGKGSAGVVLPDGAVSAVAVDGATGGRSVVQVVGGTLDYGALKKGRLVVRAQPYADVRLAQKNLGSTPFDPVSLVEGSYTVTLSYEGKKVEQQITVTPGKETVVAINMLKE